jgi:hypothetical protein
MMVWVCDKYTGHRLITADDSPGTKAARLISEGHYRVKVPQPTDLHRWQRDDNDPDGGRWVEDAELTAAASTRAKVKSLADTDMGAIRLIEDLIDILVAGDLITLDQFDAKAREKLAARKDLRSKP